MPLSLRNRLSLGVFTVIFVTCIISSFIGLRLIEKSIAERIQDKVRLDLRSARDIFQEDVTSLKERLRISALSFFASETSLSDTDRISQSLKRIAEIETLDILTLVEPDGRVIFRVNNPEKTQGSQLGEELVRRVRDENKAVSSVEVAGVDDLNIESWDLAGRAKIKIVPSVYLKSENRPHESSGMLMVAAAPVLDRQENLMGILYGARLLNKSEALVNKIIEKIYGNETFDGMEVGLATLFLFDTRIATTVVKADKGRALGTLVSDDVYDHVVNNGNTWISRPFAVDRRYITAYEPIRNMANQIVGMLSIGVLEDRFRDILRNALWSFFLVTLASLGFSEVLCYFYIKSAMKPMRSLAKATKSLAGGNLTHQVKLKNPPPEVASLANAFNTMALSISERDRELRQRAQKEIMRSERLAMIGQLAAGVAHEINNPLGSILLFTRLVYNKCPKDTVTSENLERIEREVKRCQKIVQGLLDFARQREPKAEPMNMNELLEKTIGLIEHQAMFHDIKVIKQYQENLPPSVVDPSQMQQVFINIIMNAVDAMDGRGTLTLATGYGEDPEAIEIVFSDTGCGMSQEIIDRVFEPFYTTKGVGHGTGLGLSISHGIIQRHGGSIKVISKEGEGSSFVLSLPISKESDQK
ncbi:putative Histidine kinase [uncultured Desulfobacterium sp.]|uniref:histidine kinase n=1 Tax=uncultured Desulfobacterium sp. TaxID=201089 RepID=A0A445MU57_9BACT|nr:putative Histidine kinase [uncultured Desulfobacterium sp.]